MHTQYISHSLGNVLLRRGGDIGIGVQSESDGEAAQYDGHHFDIYTSLLGNGSFETDRAVLEEFFRLRHGLFCFRYIEYDIWESLYRGIPQFCTSIKEQSLGSAESISMQKVLKKRADKKAFVDVLIQHLASFSEGVAASVVASCILK